MQMMHGLRLYNGLVEGRGPSSCSWLRIEGLWHGPCDVEIIERYWGSTEEKIVLKWNLVSIKSELLGLRLNRNHGRLTHSDALLLSILCSLHEVSIVWMKLDQNETIWQSTQFSCVLLQGSCSSTWSHVITFMVWLSALRIEAHWCTSFRKITSLAKRHLFHVSIQPHMLLSVPLPPTWMLGTVQARTNAEAGNKLSLKRK